MLVTANLYTDCTGSLLCNNTIQHPRGPSYVFRRPRETASMEMRDRTTKTRPPLIIKLQIANGIYVSDAALSIVDQRSCWHEDNRYVNFSAVTLDSAIFYVLESCNFQEGFGKSNRSGLVL